MVSEPDPSRERQLDLRDIGSMLAISGPEIDLALMGKMAADLGLSDLWSRCQP